MVRPIHRITDSLWMTTSTVTQQVINIDVRVRRAACHGNQPGDEDEGRDRERDDDDVVLGDDTVSEDVVATYPEDQNKN